MPTTTPLPVMEIVKKIGLPSKDGTLKFVRGQYFFVSGETNTALPTSFANAAQLGKMIGGDVTAITAGNNIILVLGWPTPPKVWKPQCFLCYVPAPDLINRINPVAQRAVIEGMVAAKVLTAAQGRPMLELVASINSPGA